MGRRAWLLVVALVVALAATGCGGFRTVRGSGDAETQTREVSGFSQVDFAGMGQLYVERGERESLRIEADDNLLRYLETEVRGDTLEISVRDRVALLPREPIYFYLTVQQLDEIVLSGLGSIELSGSWEVPSLSIRISGGGNVEIEDLEASTFDVEVSGLGALYIDEGKVVSQQIEINGGGNYRGRGLESERATVRVNGLGAATVRVSESLDVSIAGGGSVRYIGDPSVTQNVSGLGRVEKLRD